MLISIPIPCACAIAKQQWRRKISRSSNKRDGTMARFNRIHTACSTPIPLLACAKKIEIYSDIYTPTSKRCIISTFSGVGSTAGREKENVQKVTQTEREKTDPKITVR